MLKRKKNPVPVRTTRKKTQVSLPSSNKTITLSQMKAKAKTVGNFQISKEAWLALKEFRDSDRLKLFESSLEVTRQNKRKRISLKDVNTAISILRKCP